MECEHSLYVDRSLATGDYYEVCEKCLKEFFWIGKEGQKELKDMWNIDDDMECEVCGKEKADVRFEGSFEGNICDICLSEVEDD